LPAASNTLLPDVEKGLEATPALELAAEIAATSAVTRVASVIVDRERVCGWRKRDFLIARKELLGEDPDTIIRQSE